MGILSWLGLERRSFSSRDDELGRLFGGGLAFQGGQIVSPRTAEALSTVTACIGAISSAIASLPLYVYRRTASGREVDEGSPLMRFARRGGTLPELSRLVRVHVVEHLALWQLAERDHRRQPRRIG